MKTKFGSSTSIKDNNYCSSISTDSLDSVKNNSSLSTILNSVPFNGSGVNRRKSKHLTENMSNMLYQQKLCAKNIEEKRTSKIPKRCSKGTNVHDTDLEIKVPLSKKTVPSTQQIIFPQIRIKHYHNNKLVERILPEYKTSKLEPCIELTKHGDTKGKSNLMRNRKSKSYLEIFQSKIGLKNFGKKSESDHSTIGDNSPRILSDVADHEENNTCDFDDNSSFYLDIIENQNKKGSGVQYPSEECTSISGCVSSLQHSSLATTSVGFTSQSEQLLTLRDNSSTSPRKKHLSSNRKSILTLGGLGPDLQSVKEKKEKYLKQREYGLSVSNLNRLKIIQTNSKLNDFNKSDYNSNSVSSKPKMVHDNSSKKKESMQNIVSNSEMKELAVIDTKKKISSDSNILSYKKYKDVKTKNKRAQNNSTKFNIQDLHDRHLKEQKVVEKIFNHSNTHT